MNFLNYGNRTTLLILYMIYINSCCIYSSYRLKGRLGGLGAFTVVAGNSGN